jgi:dUTP pyrophosphatase
MKDVLIRFSKVRDVKSPSKANASDAGIDFYIPNESLLKVTGDMITTYEDQIIIMSRGRVLIPSGIKANVPEGWSLVAANKSGVATKSGLLFGAQVVDSGYQGEIHLSLINTSIDPVSIFAGQKIIQFMVVEVPTVTIEEVPLDELFPVVTARADGGFGSTGT